MTLNRKRRGFTLIELLVVIAILATIAGGILVSYDGLEADAAQAQATFNISAVDRSVRTYRTLNKAYPDELDSLLFSSSGSGSDAVALNILPAKIRAEKLGGYTLTAAGVTALTNAGVTQLRYVTGTINTGGLYDNTLVTGTSPTIPNRVFDGVGRGWGASVPLAATMIVAAVESGDGTNGVMRFGGSAVPANSNRLRDIAGLDPAKAHVVVALGLGNNSSIVAERSAGTKQGALSEAPFYTNLPKNEYGRFLVLFHLGTDQDADGVEDSEIVANGAARFVGVIDTRGDWLDEEYAEYTNQKQ